MCSFWKKYPSHHGPEKDYCSDTWKNNYVHPARENLFSALGKPFGICGRVTF
jgi:hypothetical protein